MVLYHCCTSLSRAREIARDGFPPRKSVLVAEHLSGEHARKADESHAVVLGVPWEFWLLDYTVDGTTGEHIVPARVLNLFERAVWSGDFDPFTHCDLPCLSLTAWPRYRQADARGM